MNRIVVLTPLFNYFKQNDPMLQIFEYIVYYIMICSHLAHQKGDTVLKKRVSALRTMFRFAFLVLLSTDLFIYTKLSFDLRSFSFYY